jgi:hypothetical protein
LINLKKLLPFLFSLLSVVVVNAQMDSAKIAQLATIELTKISTVVEGEVIDIEYFAGDEDGNRMPESSIVWDEQGYGYYTLSNGHKAPGYTLATVQVCQVYKGSTTLETIQVLSKPTGFVVYKMPYLDRDTTWYDFRVSISDQKLKEPYLSPRNTGHKAVFFCYQWENKPVNHLYKLSVVGGVSFRGDWRPNSHIEGKRTFALKSGIFEFLETSPILNRQEMNDFLVSIPILELDVHNQNSCIIPNIASPEKKM